MTSASQTRIAVPADAGNVRVLRVMAADAAAAAELSIDRYGDLELAITEVAANLLTGDPESLQCEISVAQGTVDVTLKGREGAEPAAFDELAAMILRSVTTTLERTGSAVHFSVASV